jgi:ubiquinone biosynthesis protein COQ4
MTEPHSFRLRPIEAARAFRASLRDPDDAEQFVRIVDALSGRSGLRMLERFLLLPGSRSLVREERTLFEVLSDRAALEALSEGSLGRAYAAFMSTEQLAPDGLVEATAQAVGDVPETDDVYVWFLERFRDSHDLWHVLTGYGRDLLGEAALLAFTHAQTRMHGFGFMAGGLYLRTLLPGLPPGAPPTENVRSRLRAMLRDGWRRGRAADWLPAQDWAALLPAPLTTVRERLAISEPVPYEPLRSVGAPARDAPDPRNDSSRAP